MFDLMKKGMLAGIGLALQTWDEVEKMVQDVQDKGQSSRQSKSSSRRPRSSPLMNSRS